MKKLLRLAPVLVLLVTLSGATVASASTPHQAPEPLLPTTKRASAPTGMESTQAQQPIIIDHTCTDLSKIPEHWIEQAKEQLRISYGHTSHGSHPISGMGGLMAGLIWEAARRLYAWYLASFASYSLIYGSVGAIIGFLLWSYLSAMIVLLGAEFTAQHTYWRRAGHPVESQPPSQWIEEWSK